jgi:glycosyltransferase involved in cell wall biosynthesis
MRVLHLSTWKAHCGPADGTASLVAALADLSVESEVFPLEVNALRYSTSDEFRAQMTRFADKAADFDLVLVQHEFGLFCGSGGLRESILHFGHLLSALEAAGRPVAVVFHTSPSFHSLTADPAHSGDAASNLFSALQSYGRRWRSRRLAAQLSTLWKSRVVPHFSGKPGGFRGLALARHVRLGLVGSGCVSDAVTLWPRGIVDRHRAALSIDPAKAKAALGISSDSVLLTIFGFIGEYKGHLLAVQALKNLPPRYHLVVLGGTNINYPSDRTLDAMLAAWEGEDPRRLIVTGYAQGGTIDRYHAGTDICLAPFRPNFHSGSGSICWSLSSGRPTIASNIPAFAEIQEQADCLLLCTPDAPRELAWQIENLAGNPALQKRLAQNALEFVASHSWSRAATMLLDIHAEMTGGSQMTIPFPAARREPLRKAA